MINATEIGEAEKQMDKLWTDSDRRNLKLIPVTRRPTRSRPGIQGPEPREAPNTELGQGHNKPGKCPF